MAGDIIRPFDLPNRAGPVASEKVPVDNGSSVGGSTIEALVNAGRPLASQVEAEAGVQATKSMSPLTTRQAVNERLTNSTILAAVARSADYNDLVNKPAPYAPFKTVTALLADTSLVYVAAPGKSLVAAGDEIIAQGFRYQVAASGASDQHITTAGGVKLYVLVNADGSVSDVQFGLPLDGNWSYGGTDVLAGLQKFASFTGTNRKRFTGVSKSSNCITFPIDTILEGAGESTGIDLSGAASLTNSAGILFDGSANLVQISDLSANVAKGATSFNIGTGSDVVPGDFFCIYNPTDWSWVSAVSAAGGRNTYRAGEWCRVQSVATNTVTVFDPLWAAYLAASVDVYRLRGKGPQLRNFRIKPPYLEVAAIEIDCAINPVVEHIRTDGSEYAGILLQRCIDEYVNCDLFQMIDAGTPGNEYGVFHSSSYGGEVHGSYYAQRHGVGFGNSDFVCSVPNRNTRVYANTYNSGGTGSLDFGHGCNENLHAIGGYHAGIALGGKNHKFVGVRVRKGNASDGTVNGLMISGGEFVGGDFVFTGCEFESVVPPTGTAVANIALTMQAAVVEPVRLVFESCKFTVESTTARLFSVVTTASGFDTSVIISNPLIVGGAALTSLARLNHVSGNGYDLVAVSGVKGLGAAVSRVATVGSPPVAKWILDPQNGTVVVAGVTAANSATAAATFPWAYPAGVTPSVSTQQVNASIGGKRCISIPASVGNSGFTATALTCDAANFATTASGTVAWRAEVI